MTEAEREPEPTGQLAESLRIRKKGHAAQRMGGGVWVVPHGPGGGFLLHSHLIHEDDSVDIKNAYGAHIEHSHDG